MFGGFLEKAVDVLAFSWR